MLTALQVVSIIRYVTKTNWELSRFLDSIRDQDYTIRYTEANHDPTFFMLNRSFGDLIVKLGEQEADKAAQNRFLKIMIDRMPIGVIVMEENGELQFINQLAQEILDLPDVRNWSNLKTERSGLFEKIVSLPVNQSEVIDHTNYKLSISITPVIIKNESLKIITVKNIANELLRNELDAWQKLIRILTHEIMNSVTPIVSITQTLQFVLNQKDTIEGESLNDAKEAVSTVNQRSKGILDFVQKYRQISKLPTPEIKPTDPIDLINRIAHLMSSDNLEIKLELFVQSSVHRFLLLADETQIEQVLINLIKNAQEASFESKKPVTVRLTAERNEAKISVIDHGSGIKPHHLERIFIPFFTTKKSGSGIGLGLSRQILQNHQGNLICEQAGNPTIFSLTLPFVTSS